MPVVPDRYANQSVTVDEVLDAIQGLLVKATGLPERRVVEWYEDGRPGIEGRETLCWFRWLSEEPDTQSGAGRHGTKTDLLVEVNLTTRTMKDTAGRDAKIGRTHLATRFLVVNALYGRMLHPAYDAPVDAQPPMPSVTTRPSADDVDRRRTSRAEVTPPVLTVGTMVSAKLPKPTHPRPEQGYIESRIGVLVPVVLRVTLNDALALTDR